MILLLILTLLALLISYAWVPGIVAIIYFAIKTTDKKEKFKRIGISAVITLFSFLFFISATTKTSPTALEVQWNQTNYDINESPKLELLVTPTDATIDSLDISDNNIAKLEYTDGQAIITFIGEGTETITFIANGSIESNTATITVVDQAKKEAEEEAKRKAEEEARKKAEEAKKKAEEEARKKAEEEARKKAEEEARKKAEEEAKKKAEEEAKKKAEEQAAQAEAERVAAEQAEAEGTATQQTTSEQLQGEMVWIPANGSKYHRSSSCSNMKNPSQVTISEAQKRGYSPCKKCY